MQEEVKHYKVKTLSAVLRPNSVYYVKANSQSTVKTYITDQNGFPYPLIDLSNSSTIGVQSVTGTGVTGTTQNPKVDITTFLSTETGNIITLSTVDGKLYAQIDVPTKTSDLTNDGEDGVNPFITAQQIPATPTLEQVVTAGNSSSKDIVLSNANKIKSTDGKKFLEVDATSARIVAYGGELPFPDTEARVQVETSGAVLIQGEAAQINIRSAAITGQDLTFKGLEYTEDNSANFVDRSLVDKGYVSGQLLTKADLVDGKVPSEQLPSYVDDVIEVANFAGLPLTGESGKIYITIDDSKSFRWGGSVYVEIASANKLGLIKIVDKAGSFFTSLATASAYIRTFTSATITDESYSNGTFWFTVPNGSSFALATGFLEFSSAYIEDELGLINAFSNEAFLTNSGNNILGNCTFNGSCFNQSSGNNILGNCTFDLSCFSFAKGIYKFKNILLLGASYSFGANSSGRFEIYGNIGTTEGANYTNFFPTTTAVIWAQKAKETSNAGGIEGDLATAQANGAKLFFGYTDKIIKTSELINDGDDGISHFISINDLPANIILYPTTVISSIPGYYKLVSSITDPSYNTIAVDVPTGVITTTNQLISSLVTSPSIIVGNPGVFNITVIGNITRLSGTGTAEFYFEVYKRTIAGVETLITTSDNTIPVINSGYSEFSATALWNDGVFIATDSIVLKFYANRISGGSNPSYQFQFGGTSPVRTLVPIPLAVVPQTSSTRRNANNSTDTNINYCGVALGTGISESLSVWTITRLTITASGFVTTTTATNVAWIDRETVVYI